MLTGIVYNCDPQSLADISPEAFVDAFENEVRAARTCWQDLKIEVTFNPGKSEVTGFCADPLVDSLREGMYDDEFKRLAEKAFDHCCRQEA